MSIAHLLAYQKFNSGVLCLQQVYQVKSRIYIGDPTTQPKIQNLPSNYDEKSSSKVQGLQEKYNLCTKIINIVNNIINQRK